MNTKGLTNNNSKTMIILSAIIILFFGLPGILVVTLLWLQVFLSKKENRWWGLLIPILFFGASLNLLTHVDDRGVLSVIGIFLSTNIFTLISVIIYYICRENLKIKARNEKVEMDEEMRRTNIQDL